MFNKILYPTDLSDVAAKSLDYIKQLRKAGGREVVILNVINQRIINGLMRHAIQDNEITQWQKAAEALAEESISEMKKELENAGYTVKTLIETGYPSEVILGVEKNENPSVIVIGSHGRSNLSDMLLGSVSDRVIRKCKGPVLVIKREGPGSKP